MDRLWIGGALLALLLPQPGHAQIVVRSTGGAFVTGGLSGSWHGHRHTVTVGFTRTTVSRFGAIGPPFFGGFYGFASAPWLPPAIIVPPPAIVPVAIFVPVRAEEIVDPRIANPERFIIIKPDKPNDLARNKLPEQPPPPLVAKANPMPVDLGVKPGAFPLAPGRAANPRFEADRQVDQGRAAFANGEYGRSIEHFRQSISAAPEDALAYFLLAQAQFAVGKYDDAVASLVDGLKRRPDWPKSLYRSRELYRNDPAVFDEQLRILRAALEADPNDARLLFLLGVQLWFDGQPDEAKMRFQKAVRLAKEPEPILAFLR